MPTAAALLVGAVLGAAAGAAAAWRAGREWVRRRGRLMAFALHELNTPVTAVNLTLVNLLSGVFGEVPAEPLKWIGLTRDQVGRLNALAGELRDLVHLEMIGRLELTRQAARPEEILETALAAGRGALAHADIELKASVESGLPEVLTDPERAARSLTSLLFHARKFRVRGPVTLRARPAGERVLIEVEYEGRLLPPEEAAASLDLLYPAHPRNDEVLSATGLGLGLVRELMRRTGGDLAFSSDATGRSRLTLSLPVRP